MPMLVVHGAMLRCNQGLAPSTLAVLPLRAGQADELPLATVRDHTPMVNVLPFGLCRSPANPQVAAATAAAGGALTPQPCLPLVAAPWSPGGTVVTVDDVAALTSNSTCACQWGGVIEIAQPGTQIEGA